jgi:hypothetical protein
MARRRITTKLDEASFKAPTLAASDGVSVGVGFMQREAATALSRRWQLAGALNAA